MEGIVIIWVFACGIWLFGYWAGVGLERRRWRRSLMLSKRADWEGM